MGFAITAQRRVAVMAIVVATGIGCSAPAPVTTDPAPSATSTPLPTVRPTDRAMPSPSRSPTHGATTTSLPVETTPSLSPTKTPAGTARITDISLLRGDIERHLDALQEIADGNSGTRAAGTPGYDASAEYVLAQLQEMGYSTLADTLEFTSFDEAAPVALTIGDDSWTGAEWLHAMLYSAGGHVSAIAETVGIKDSRPTATAGCEQSDWREFVRGRVALVMPGPCLRRDVLEHAQDAGATALISLYLDLGSGQTRRPTLFDPSGVDIPVVLAGRDPATALLDAARDGSEIGLSVQVDMQPATAANVIGEKAGDGATIIMLGAHLDSVHDGPGINDNGSGVATVLAIAGALARQPPPAQTVRFAFWAAEEYGGLGSIDYVNRLSSRDSAGLHAGAYINLDMVASPNGGRWVFTTENGPPMESEISSFLLRQLEAMGSPGLALDAGSSSDHAPFQGAGIPIGGVFSGIGPLTSAEAELFDGDEGVLADSCYHLSCDNRNNVDVQLAATLGSAIAAFVEDRAYRP